MCSNGLYQRWNWNTSQPLDSFATRRAGQASMELPVTVPACRSGKHAPDAREAEPPPVRSVGGSGKVVRAQ